MKTEDKLQYLAGQHQALLAAVSALIRTHHSPTLIARQLRASMETVISITLGTTVQEQYMRGLQEERESLLAIADASANERNAK